VLEEIEELTNPKVKAGKKALSPEQTQLKASVLAVLDVVRDESSKDAPVRLVFEPKTRTHRAARTHHRFAGAHQLGNIVAHQPDHGGHRMASPCQKSLRQMLAEWITFRQQTMCSAARNTAWTRCWTASTSWKAVSWCCSTSTR
jgi:topoisomerase-4 subunit A